MATHTCTDISTAESINKQPEMQIQRATTGHDSVCLISNQ